MKLNKRKSGNKKHGRSVVKCARYRAEGRREKNKARKMAKQQKIYERAQRKRQKRLDKSE